VKVSVIVPVRNGGADFERCLGAVRAALAACAELAEGELIVVDDGSTDASRAAAQAAGARLLATPAPGGHGPALARNLGAAAADGDVLFFVDADVALHPGALRSAVLALQAEPGLEACFGSYDDSPAQTNFLSQYKNLLHHYVHQQAGEWASTFWTGCGAIRRATFAALGGFDAHTYQRPSIEDIDLGYRLRRQGGQIRLLKHMQCKHLKRWTAGRLLRSDIFERGVPWTILLWRESRARHASEPPVAGGDTVRGPEAAVAGRPFQLDLNLQTSNRVSVALTGLLAASLVALPWLPQLWPAPLGLAAALLGLNWRLYAFFSRRRGLAFCLGAILWHWLYYLYNSFSFGLGTLTYHRNAVRPLAADGTLPAETTAAEADQAPPAGGDGP
jgi:glycosyltransferase involved in cell wall biosynthesis